MAAAEVMKQRRITPRGCRSSAAPSRSRSRSSPTSRRSTRIAIPKARSATPASCGSRGRRHRGLGPRAVERARPRAADSAHLRLRAHPGRVPEDGPRRHGVRAPGGAEARRAVRPRRRLRAVPAEGVPGLPALQRRSRTSPSARGSRRSPTSIARRARRRARAPPCSWKTWTTSPNGWRGAAWSCRGCCSRTSTPTR